MKIKFLIQSLLILLLTQCTPPQTQFDWLLGEWQRVETNSTSTTFETWVKEGNHYVGHGYVMQGVDTVWQEHMVLQNNDESWEFVVSTSGNDDAVTFTLAESDSESFVVANPEHDFPKRIAYSRKGAELHALVTGGDTKLTYQFVSIN